MYIKFLLVLIIIQLSIQQCPLDGIYITGVNDKEKFTIVNKHNELRLEIAKGGVSGQPKGTNLKKMKWDQTLADQAQHVANICKFEHLISHDERWGNVGQNLYTSFSTAIDNKGSDWNKAVTEWFNEHKLYQFSNGFSPATGHYTQMIWADTQYIGCGYIYFRRPNHHYAYQKLYVCNYGPAGNIIGQTPYQTEGNQCPNLC